MDSEFDLIYSPKRNWHYRKQWGKGIHPRRVTNHWSLLRTEQIMVNDKGIPELTYAYWKPEEQSYDYETIAIRSGANIEKRWLRGYRYRNDDPSGYWCGPVIAGKSSRRGMKEKARWWQEAYSYLQELEAA